MEENQNVKTRPRIGLALGSGAARGYAHIGVLKALYEANIPIDVIAGTSMGAVVGALYAMGYPIEELENMAIQMRWRLLSYFAEPTIPRQGIIAGNKIEKYLESLTQGIYFDQLKKPLIVVATDILSGEEVRINKGSLAKALRASVAIPGLFTPVKLEEKLLVDGSLTASVPFLSVMDYGADIIIAVDVSSDLNISSQLTFIWKRLDKIPSKRAFYFVKNPRFEILKIVGNTIKICNNDKNKQSMLTKISNKYYISLKPDVGYVRWYEFYKARECIDAGEIAGKQLVDKLNNLLKFNINSIDNSIIPYDNKA